jgi:hypothetical protein
MPKALGVVHVLVAGEPTEHRLPKHSDQTSLAILAGAAVSQNFIRHTAQAERVVEFSIGEQASVGGDDRSAKLQRQAPVKIEPERIAIRFTRRVRHDLPIQLSTTS